VAATTTSTIQTQVLGVQIQQPAALEAQPTANVSGPSALPQTGTRDWHLAQLAVGVILMGVGIVVGFGQRSKRVR
jgi:LPXTG-motif cell wall-anchored protein